MKSALALFVVVAFLTSSAPSQDIPEKTRRAILTAQDTRDAKTIAAFLSDKNPSARALAAVACGSLQDTSHIGILSDLLSDQKNDVRTAAAFALGQLTSVVDTVQRAFISRILLKRLGLERNASALSRVVEALGKVGNDQSLNVMVASGENFPAVSLKCEAALSVGRYAYRGIVSKTATAFSVDVLNSVRSGDEWKAAYALMRINDASLLSRHAEEIAKFASHRNPDVRMFVASALGRLSSSVKGVNALLSLVLSDKDWRVRVNAIKAISKIDSVFYPRVLPLLLQMISESNEHVSLTVLSSLGEMRLRTSPFSTEFRKTLVEVIVNAGYSQRHKKEAALALGKTLGSEAYLILADKFRTGHLTATNYIPALAHTPTPDALVTLSTFAEDSNSRLQRQALEAIQTIASDARWDAERVKLARPVFLTALRSPDIAVITTAATALAHRTFADERSVPGLVETLRRLKAPDDSEAIIAVIQALGELKSMAAVAPLQSELNNPDRNVVAEAIRALEKITGKSYAQFLKPDTSPAYMNHDWSLLDWIRKNPRVYVRTSKGSFTFKMLPENAPFTCINFGALILKGFFDSLVFHRVVPNFVIQGGDPRGDGWGGPGYSIRSEFGFEHYERGAVGVASSGKDTEGCQWFVTHSSTPHLDGRYTIFGSVISGMDVVGNIQVGDIIEEVRFEK